MYLRLGKAGEKEIYTEKLQNLTIGDVLTFREEEQQNKGIILSGSIADYAINFLKEKEINWNVYTLPFIKPINVAHIKKIVTINNELIILEEHQKSCGIGSAILEIVNDLYVSGEIISFPKIKRIAIDDRFYSISGSQDFLRKEAGLIL